jgi:hypothetical protein
LCRRSAIENLAPSEIVYERLFAGVELVGDALCQRHEFDEEEIEAGDVYFWVEDVVIFGLGGVGFGGHGRGW